MTEPDLFKIIPELSQIEQRSDPAFRGIKSYVLRGQRLKDYQINALVEHFYDFSIIFNNQFIDYKNIFGNSNPVIFEIGFGMGDVTASIATDNPDKNYIGIEVFLYGFSKLLSRAVNMNLKNLKIMRFDAVQVLENMVKDNSVDGFHIFFPDPWQKERHHKRRLIQPPFADLLASKLKPNGYIYCVTDWQDYANQILDVFSHTNGLKNCYEGFAPSQSWRPTTNFERKGLEKSHTINEILFNKAFM